MASAGPGAGAGRQYIPKGMDFSELTDEMLAEIEWKKFFWESPFFRIFDA